MKRYLVMLLLLVLSSFVVAQGSEISASFSVGTVEEGRDYVPSPSFWDTYGNCIIGLIVILIIVKIVYLFSRKPKKKVKHRKVKAAARNRVPSKKRTASSVPLKGKAPSSSGKKKVVRRKTKKK